jgi:uncharacterized protein
MEAVVATGAEKMSGRTCVGCGRRRAPAQMIRVSAVPSGFTVHFGRGDGRGAYLCPERGCFESAVRRKGLQRVLKADLGPLSIRHLSEAVDRAVRQRVLRLLGLARRARKVVTGVRAVTHALAAGQVRLILLSREIPPRLGGPLEIEAERVGVPVVTGVSREETASALGGPSREAIGLLDDAVADGVLWCLRFRVSLDNAQETSGEAQVWGTGGGRRG